MHLSRKAVFFVLRCDPLKPNASCIAKSPLWSGLFSGNVDDGSYATIVLRQNVSAAVTVVFFVVVHDAPA